MDFLEYHVYTIEVIQSVSDHINKFSLRIITN